MNFSLNVVLVKSNDQANLSLINSGELKPTDRYIDYVRNQKCAFIDQIESINVLSFELINTNKFEEIIFNLFLSPQKNFKSLILTSRQTVEAIEIALKNLIDYKVEAKYEDLAKITAYCVGHSTAAKFNELLSKYKSITNGIFEIKQVGSKQTASRNGLEHLQNALELSRLIIRDFQNESSNMDINESKFAFYPCSSIRKDDLSNELLKANVTFDELNVYKTVHSQYGLLKLENLLVDYLNELNQAENSRKHAICLTFFSPSGVEACLGGNSVPNLTRLILDNISYFRFVSIGPSTSSKLKHFIADCAQLNEPSPTSLYQTLLDIHDNTKFF